ncbi:hypothetical protein Hanom_Chr05g00428051 [Helianthus anomalus]
MDLDGGSKLWSDLGVVSTDCGGIFGGERAAEDAAERGFRRPELRRVTGKQIGAQSSFWLRRTTGRTDT